MNFSENKSIFLLLLLLLPLLVSIFSGSTKYEAFWNSRAIHLHCVLLKTKKMIRISHFIFKHCTLYKLRNTRKYTHSSNKIHAEACGYAPQNAKPELNATMFFSDLMCVAMLPKYTHLVQRTNWRHADIGTYYRKAPDKLFSGKVKKYILVQWACSMWLYNFVIFIAPKMTECISIFRTIFSYYVEFTLAIPSVSLKLWSISFFRYLRCYHCSRVQFLCKMLNANCADWWKSEKAESLTDWIDCCSSHLAPVKKWGR